MTSDVVLHGAHQDHVHRGGEPVCFGIRLQDIESASDVSTMRDICQQKNPNRLNPKLNFVNRQAEQEKRRLETLHLPAMTWDDWLAKREEWGAAYDGDEHMRENARKDLIDTKSAPGSSPAAPASSPVADSYCQNALGIGCKEFPISPTEFEQWLSQRDFGSFSSAGKALLTHGSSLVRKTIIPAGNKRQDVVASREMCWELHPGLCRTRDTILLPLVSHVCHNLSVVVDNLKIGLPKTGMVVGHYFKAQAMGADGNILAERSCVVGRCVFRPIFQVVVVVHEADGVFKLARRSATTSALATEFSFEFFGGLLRDCPPPVAVHLQALQVMAYGNIQQAVVMYLNLNLRLPRFEF